MATPKTFQEMAEKALKRSSKTCFVACPLDEDGTPVRTRTEGVLKYLIRPVLEDLGYNVVAPHEVQSPGDIPTDVVTHLVKDELVIADLTGVNPNVMYELGIRHSAREPVITICGEKRRLPFDIAQNRTIFYNPDTWLGQEETQAILRGHVETVETDRETACTSPVTRALGESRLLSFPAAGEGAPDDRIGELARVVVGLRDDIRSLKHRETGFYATGGEADLASKPWSSDTINVPDSLMRRVERYAETAYGEFTERRMARSYYHSSVNDLLGRLGYSENDIRALRLFFDDRFNAVWNRMKNHRDSVARADSDLGPADQDTHGADAPAQ
jgi:hypothetical protein